MDKKKGKVTALYERLSRDDEQFGDSVSIVNQKDMLASFAAQNGFTNIRHYTDDGYSGGSFERPGWKKMIEDIEAGEVSTVIAKDMSRIGRNYLEVGYFTEVYFSQKNIRFIAVSNNVDSTNQSSSEFAPFLNIMNEWYLRDCSNKIKASKRNKGNSGKHLAVQPPYGYIKDPNDKQKWLVDEEAAEVVRHIFQLCIDGNGTEKIAAILRDEQIDTPSYHAARMGTGSYRSRIDSMVPYNWNGASVKDILSRPDYLGCTVNFKTSSKSYKEHKNIINTPDKWAIFEKTQEPIIDRTTWQLVQKLLGTPRKRNQYGDNNPLTGLVFCADCGAKMYRRQSSAMVDRSGKKQSAHDCYDCSTYKLASKRSGGTQCTNHYISTKALSNLILHTIKNVCRIAVTDREGFIKKVQKDTDMKKEAAMKDMKRKRTECQRRYQEIDQIYKKLYESFALGTLPEDKFNMLSSGYLDEQKRLKTEMQKYEAELADYDKGTINIENFYKLVDKYTEFNELTPAMINEFVEKVLVHAPIRTERSREQKVEIYLNFVGNVDFPEPEITEEELEQAKIDTYWKDRYWRSRNYELARRKRIKDKQLQELDAAEQEAFEKRVDSFRNEIHEVGAENMPVIPARI